MWFFAKNKDFLKMLLNQSAKVTEGLTVLVKFLREQSSANAELVDHIEEEADELRRIIIDELNLTFVTPIDREDIFALSRAIDDIMDYAKSTVEEMTLFQISPDDYIREMVDTLLLASRDIHAAIDNLKTHPRVSEQHIVRAKKAENSVEHCYRKGLVELFKTNDVIRILKTREVYRHLSNAADRVVESANVLGDILVKTS